MTREASIVLVVDDLTCVTRLEARTRYGLHLDQFHGPSASDQLANFLYLIANRLRQYFYPSPEIVNFLQHQCETVGLPLVSVIRIVEVPPSGLSLAS